MICYRPFSGAIFKFRKGGICVSETQQKAPKEITVRAKLRRKGLKFLALCERARVGIAKHPVSPLLYAVILALVVGYVTFNGMYTKAYVLTVAKNAAINLSKQEQKFQHHTVTDAQEIGFDPGLDAQSDQSLRCVIATLPAFQRDILMLRYTNDMNCSEIAIALGRKPSTVRKELSRARQALRKRCKKEGIDIED
jgi:RNA polymerase sigma factor (sigma-70 family)